MENVQSTGRPVRQGRETLAHIQKLSVTFRNSSLLTYFTDPAQLPLPDLSSHPPPYSGAREEYRPTETGSRRRRVSGDPRTPDERSNESTVV